MNLSEILNKASELEREVTNVKKKTEKAINKNKFIQMSKSYNRKKKRMEEDSANVLSIMHEPEVI